MKDIKVKVVSYDDRGSPEPPNNYSVLLYVGKHAFDLSGGCITREKAEGIAGEVRRTLTEKAGPASVTMDEVEKQRADEFTSAHPYACGSKDDFTIQYTATGVGTKKTIVCKGCHEEKDITNYDSW